MRAALFAFFLSGLTLVLFAAPPPSDLPGQNDWQIARRLASAGQVDQALPLYARLYAQDPNPVLYRDYLQALEQQALYKEAENLIRRQLKKEDNPLYTVDLAALYLQQNQAAKADKTFLRAIQDYLQQNGVGINLQELSLALIQKSNAVQYSLQLYQKARNKEGLASAYAYELFQCYLRLQQTDKMVKEAQLFISTQGTSIEGAQALEKIQADLQGQLLSKNASDLKQALYSAQQKDPMNWALSELLIWALLQENNYEEALKISKNYIDRFKDGGQKTLETAQTAIENKAYTEAEKALSFLIENGRDPQSSIHPQTSNQALMARLDLHFKQLEQGSQIDHQAILHLKNEYEQLWNAHQDHPDFWPVARNLARIYAYYTHENLKAQEVVERVIANPRIHAQKRAEIKVEYADILLFMGKSWDAMLLYGQVEKDFKQDAIGFYAKLQNAKLSYYMGEFEWALSQLDVLRAATAKLIANDAMELSLMIRENNNADSTYDGLRYVARADALTYRHLYKEALLQLDSVLAMPWEGQLYEDAHYKKAQIYQILDSVNLALSCWKKVYQPTENDKASLWADDALWLSAQTLEKSKDSSHLREALDLYQQLFTRFPSSLLSPKAKECYRTLRGILPIISPKTQDENPHK